MTDLLKILLEAFASATASMSTRSIYFRISREGFHEKG